MTASRCDRTLVIAIKERRRYAQGEPLLSAVDFQQLLIEPGARPSIVQRLNDSLIWSPNIGTRMMTAPSTSTSTIARATAIGPLQVTSRAQSRYITSGVQLARMNRGRVREAEKGHGA